MVAFLLCLNDDGKTYDEPNVVGHYQIYDIEGNETYVFVEPGNGVI